MGYTTCRDYQSENFRSVLPDSWEPRTGSSIVICGIGGHASHPHECKDAIVCACSIVNQMQKVVSRIVDPAHLAVVSVTAITGKNIKNVISSEALVECDYR